LLLNFSGQGRAIGPVHVSVCVSVYTDIDFLAK